MVIYSKSFVLNAVVTDFEGFPNIVHRIGILWLHKHSLQNFLRKLLAVWKAPKEVQTSRQTVNTFCILNLILLLKIILNLKIYFRIFDGSLGINFLVVSFANNSSWSEVQPGYVRHIENSVC
jgi:hypothetical protein